nr:MAG TPA: hypothetical protein [Caudoviricetes sp.]
MIRFSVFLYRFRITFVSLPYHVEFPLFIGILF